MKTKFFIILFAISASIGNAFAAVIERVQIGELYYNLDTSSQTAEVTYKSEEPGYYGTTNYNKGWDISVANIPSTVVYGNNTYNVTIIGENAFHSCYKITEISLPPSIDSIKFGAFISCSGIKEMILPERLISIGDYAIASCTGLTSISIPKNVKSIGDYAFKYCTKLTNITIPNSVKSIGMYAFKDCNMLSVVRLQSNVPPTLGNHAFSYSPYTSVVQPLPNVSIIVPCGSLNTYKNSWTEYASIIKNPDIFYTTTGYISGGKGQITTPQTICDDTIITAIPDYGYRFVQWSDGILDNPRAFVLTQDTAFTAELSKNPTITFVYDKQQGYVKGDTTLAHDTIGEATFCAVPRYGYHFVRWGDGITDNPRTIILSKDTSFIAEFDLDRYGKCGNDSLLTWKYDTITKTLQISGDGAFVNNIQCGIEARSKLETLIIGQGITAIHPNAFIDCLNLISVKWYARNCTDITSSPFLNTLSSISFIEGVEHIPAHLCNNLTEISSIVIPSSVRTIGDYAFANINNRKINNIVLPSKMVSIGNGAFAGNTYLEQIDFGTSIESIGARAFDGCSRVVTMKCLAEMTPDVGTDALASISNYAELYVLNSAIRKYQVDANWNRFLLKEIGAEETTMTQNTIIIVPTDNTATITWPITENADSYTIEITKDGDVFCTLTFNANGQLAGIAFAPNRNGRSHHTSAATMTANGLQFTVTGLNSTTQYGYNVTAKNASNVVASYSGIFTTTGQDVETKIDDVVGNASSYNKIIKNGQIYIRRGEKVYTVTGQEVK